MPVVGPRLRDDIDHTGRCASEFCDATRVNDLELTDDFLAIETAGVIGCIVIGRQPVNDKTIIDIALAGHRDARARHR